MIDPLFDIAKKHSLSIEELEGKYNRSFELRNLPSKKVTLEKVTALLTISASYQFLWGSSSKPSYSAGNETDHYIARIKCTIKNTSIPDFHIIEGSLWHRWIKKVPMKTYCSNRVCKKDLNSLTQTNFIFNKCKETAELSPTIRATSKDDDLEVDINFQSYFPYFDIFDQSIEFCNELSKMNTTLR